MTPDEIINHLKSHLSHYISQYKKEIASPASNLDLKLSIKYKKLEFLEYIFTCLPNIVNSVFSSTTETHEHHPMYLAYSLYANKNLTEEPNKKNISRWIRNIILESSSENSTPHSCYVNFWKRHTGSKTVKILSSFPDAILNKIFSGTDITAEDIVSAAFLKEKLENQINRFILLKNEFESNNYQSRTAYINNTIIEKIREIHATTLKILINYSKRRLWAKNTTKIYVYNKCITEIHSCFSQLIYEYNFKNLLTLLRCFMSYRLAIYEKKSSSSFFADALRAAHKSLLKTIKEHANNNDTTTTVLLQYEQDLLNNLHNKYKSNDIYVEKNNIHYSEEIGLDIQKSLGQYFLNNYPTNYIDNLPTEVKPTLRRCDAILDVAKAAEKERFELAALGNEEAMRHLYPIAAKENLHLYSDNESLYDVFFKNPSPLSIIPEYPELLYSTTLQVIKLQDDFAKEIKKIDNSTPTFSV